MWKLDALVSGTVVMLGVTGVLVGTVFLTSIFLQTTLGYSAVETWAAFLPFAFAITAGTVVAKFLLGHVSRASVAVLSAVASTAGTLTSASGAADASPGASWVRLR